MTGKGHETMSDTAKINDGGPAFPVPPNYGMSVRDYFAGCAMGGILADPSVVLTPTEAAKCAYEVADAMISKRDEKP
jgi:hypothetical protein